jgi:hypothetical protein
MVLSRVALAGVLVLGLGAMRGWAQGKPEAADLTKARGEADSAQKAYDKADAQAQPENATVADDAADAARDAADAAQAKARADQDAYDKAKAAADNNAKSVPGEPTTAQKEAAAEKTKDASVDAAVQATKDAAAAEAKADLKSGPLHKAKRKARARLRKAMEDLLKKLAKYGLVANVPFSPGEGMGLAALVRDGKVAASATPTGETIGHVADVVLSNKTDQILDVVIPATVLVSASGKTQDFGIPSPTRVALKPGETAKVPMEGICTQAHRPPGGAEMAGGLMIADPEDAGFAKYRPELICTQAVVETAEGLEESGQIHTPFHNDPQKELQTVEQQTIWAANPSHDGKNTTKEDMAKKVYEQTGATTDEQKKALQPGIDSIWSAVQLTGAKAKVFETGGEGGAASDDTPKTEEKPVPYVGPKGSTVTEGEPDGKGKRTIKYTDAEGGEHTITIDGKGHAIETVEKEGKKLNGREYDIHFDKKTGGRTETESTKSGDSSTDTEREYDANGTMIRRTETTFTEGKTAEKPSGVKTTETKFDKDGVRTESSETDMTYHFDLDAGQNVPTSGTKTTWKHDAKGKRIEPPFVQKFNIDTGNFEPDAPK